MTNKYLLFFWLLSLSLVGGCAQHVTKPDRSATAPSAEPSPQQDAAQAKSAAQTTAADKAPDAATSPTQAAGNDPAPQAAPKAVQAATKANVKEAAPVERAAAAALLPLPPKEIVDTIRMLTHHPRVRYLSRSAQYDYYVGGRVDAKYDINKNELLVTNAPAEEKTQITCEYSKNGDLVSGKKAMSSQKIEECNTLINELTTYMNR